MESIIFGEPYDEKKYYRAFKQVRNRIRGYFPEEIILECMRRLYHYDYSDEPLKELKQCPPWFLLLLIKWTILFGDYLSIDRRHPTINVFNEIINLIHRVENVTRLPSQYASLLLFLRSTAYQQFWLQHGISLDGLARQSLLFRGLEKNHSYQKWFFEEVEISIEHFIELSYAILTRFAVEKHISIRKDWFTTIEHSYPKNTIHNFLEAISASPAEVRDYLLSLEEQKDRVSHEFKERTPLIRFPMLKISSEYYPYSRRLLFHSLQYFIYDTLRRRDAQAFMGKFGPIFESYVKLGLEYSEVEYIDESRILKSIGRGENIVDFLILGDRSNILVDAKGVEIGHQGMVSNRSDIVTERVKSSVLKAIVQGIETAHSLSKSQDFRNREWSRARNFLVVVTFKDLYLGTGKDFYEDIAKDKLERKLNGDPYKQIIPIEHIYFVSISEWDWMMHAVHKSLATVSSILSEAVKRDSNSSSKRFLMAQHLQESFHEFELPMYIQNEIEAVEQSCIQRFRSQ